MSQTRIDLFFDDDACPICGMEGAPHRCDENDLDEIDAARGEVDDTIEPPVFGVGTQDEGLRLQVGLDMMAAEGAFS